MKFNFDQGGMEWRGTLRQYNYWKPKIGDRQHS